MYFKCDLFFFFGPFNLWYYFTLITRDQTLTQFLIHELLFRTLKGDTRHNHITNTSQTINMNPKHQVRDT